MISPTVSGLQQSLIEPLIWKECPHIFRLNYSLTSTIDWYILSQSRNTGSFFIPHWACRELLLAIYLIPDKYCLTFWWHSLWSATQPEGFLASRTENSKERLTFPLLFGRDRRPPKPLLFWCPSYLNFTVCSVGNLSVSVGLSQIFWLVFLPERDLSTPFST